MNGTIFSDEERVELLNVFEAYMCDCGVEKKDLSNAQRVLYLKLGGDLSDAIKKSCRDLKCKGGLDGNM